MALYPAILKHSKEHITLVANKVYSRDEVPNKIAAPYLTFQKISSEFVHSMGGDSGLTKTRIQFNCHGVSRETVEKIAGQVKATYRNYTQGSEEDKMGADEDGEGGHWVQTTMIAGEIDLGREEDKVIRVTAVDVFFWHREVD